MHIGTQTGLAFVSLEIGIPDAVMVERPERPPKGWRAEPPGPPSMRVGSNWLRERRSVALAVPSVLVPQEVNVLLNPAHPDFVLLKIERPKRFEFDPRMWK